MIALLSAAKLDLHNPLLIRIKTNLDASNLSTDGIAQITEDVVVETVVTVVMCIQNAGAPQIAMGELGTQGVVEHIARLSTFDWPLSSCSLGYFECRPELEMF